ncbi:MAG: PAS domain-containing sensor histidine kinase [Candidatus Melainabacteria bacterium]|nr:PAS domain-containing sensor histidine kinase [Candidatus Melainabacteria bacterium]
MRSKLVILGLSIVAVPALIQLALLLGMSSLLWSIQQESLAARESRAKINRLDNCMIKITEFFFLPVVSETESAPGNRRSDNEIIAEIAAVEKEARDLLDANEYEGAAAVKAERVRAMLDEFTSIGAHSLERIRKGRTHEERNQVMDILGPAADRFAREVTGLIEIEKAQRQQITELKSHHREQAEIWLLSTAILSLIASGVMAVFFSARIKKPIRRISDNLQALSNNAPLQPPLKTSDELGALDRLIHSVADEINLAIERERSAVEKAADLICVLDESGGIVSVNGISELFLGLTPAELKGRRLSSLCLAEQILEADELVRNTISSNQARAADLTLERRDGSTVDTRWSCLWSDREEELFCVARDISREKQLQKMKMDFMSMISHDLRSPLTSMIGGLTILASGIKGELPPAMKEEAEAAIASAQKLVAFINDLLDYQKLDEGKMPLELSDNEIGSMLGEATEIVRPLATVRSIEIEAPVTGTDLIRCDRNKIVQVIINLLSNAVKFSPEGSSITIRVSSSPTLMKIAIDNQGEPIPEDYRCRIFEPFEQTPASRHQGTGLGLAICKMIVEAHEGAIGLEDLKNEDRSGQTGTRFWLELKRR